MKRRLVDFLNGYIIIRIEGLNPERFINIASRNGISFWDITKIDYVTIQLKMKHSQYKRLKRIAKRTGTRVHIRKKKGLNFIVHRVSKRKFFVLGIFIFIGIIIYLSSLVWSIEIEGNKNIPSSEIYQALKKAGLEEWKPKYKINVRDIEADTLKEMDRISVINIKMIGTKAKVYIVERKMPPNMEYNGRPANIIALKDGIILNILSYKGKALVDIGDYVRKGQILISGIVTDSMNAPTGIVRAKGKIIAKTWYEAIEKIPLDYVYEERTGRVKKIEYVDFCGKVIYLKKDTLNFEKYDKIEEKNIINIAGIKTPLIKTTEYYYEKVKKNIKLDYKKALEMALKSAESNILANMPKEANIIDKQIQKQMGNNIVKVKLLYITEEQIGVLSEIQ